MRYVLDRRQFAVARAPVTVDSTWETCGLPEGWVLSYQSDLALSERREADGRTVFVLGVAPGEELLDTATSGRYAVVDWPYVATDRGAGALAVFHAEGVAASSARLAAAVSRGGTGGDGAPSPPAPDNREELRHPSPMNYVPSPGSRYRGVRRLVRDQRVNLLTGGVEHHPGPLPPAASYQQAVDLVAEELTRFARVLRERTPGRIHLQLTAGLDTRTLFAAFRAAGVGCETVTFHTPYKRNADASVAGALSRAAGLRHSVIDPRATPDPAAAETYFRQISGGMNGVDLKLLFPGDAYRFLEAGDVMVGGLGFEVGRQKFRDHFGGMSLETASGAALWRGLTGATDRSEFPGFIDEWLDWRRRHPYPFDLVTSCYLDQRLGAWASTLMCGFDLLPGATVHPAASARIIAAMLTPPFEAQVEGRLQHDVIRALAPELTRFPINPVPLRRRIRTAVGQARRAVRRMF
jgi:hypothetical protein